MTVADLKEPLEQRLDAEDQEQAKKDAQKKTYCVWANIPYFCHVVAESEEEAKQLAAEDGAWEACDTGDPRTDDIYDVSELDAGTRDLLRGQAMLD